MPSQEISVNDAQAGMITARDILDENGRVLIQKGARLSPVAIRRLPLWNITSIVIDVEEQKISKDSLKYPESHDNESDNNIDTAFISELAVSIKNRFKNIEQDDFYKSYMTVLLRHIVNNNANGGSIIPGFY